MRKMLLILVTAFIVTNVNAQEEGVVINGVKWATRNVDMPGYFTASPEDAGMFYQWNRKIGWTVTDPMVNSNGGTIWDNSIPEGDSWIKANDPCPTGWRVPTHEELQSLINSGSEWTALNSVNGRYFGTGEQRIFFPAAGYRVYNYGELDKVGSYGNYWSGTLYPGPSEYPYFMYFVSGDKDADMNSVQRGYGFSVRCVSDDNVGVNEVSNNTETATVIGYFDILGKRLNEAPKQGVYIILYDNGKTRKVMSLKE
jgi:uncharacterized protein (TIGR02145 family)